MFHLFANSLKSEVLNFLALRVVFVGEGRDQFFFRQERCRVVTHAAVFIESRSDFFSK